jgi:hypothetical protein
MLREPSSKQELPALEEVRLSVVRWRSWWTWRRFSARGQPAAAQVYFSCEPQRNAEAFRTSPGPPT